MHQRIPDGTFDPLDHVNYGRNRHTPRTYKCGCGLNGVKLFREAQSSSMHCVSCVNAHLATHDHTPIDINGVVPHEIQIGDTMLIAAIPTVQNDAHWAHKQAPKDAIEWWNRLPVTK